MGKQHYYTTQIEWTGNRGEGTSGYRNYDRAHTIQVNNKEIIKASSDPAFLGDATRYNPEDLLLASLSSCHMLWYLHLCSDAGIIVTAYSDNAKGIMEENENSGKFTTVTLYPVVTITDATMKTKAATLHEEANKKCFIANSCNFPVKHEVTIHVVI